jgi:hypothetical protein
MKKLAALASMAVLLCASASFAKKAMNEEEMELVTAAGQPSVIVTKVDVESDQIGRLTSTTSTDTGVTSTLTPGDTTGNTASVESVEATAVEANLALQVGSVDVTTGPLGPSVGIEDGAAGLNIDFSQSEIESFSLSVSSGTGTLTATSSASATSTISPVDAVVISRNEDASIVTLLVATSSQTNLRAVVLNNVAGENQLATAVNIQAGVQINSGTQSNTINQSWGSTYDWSFAPGDIKTAATAAKGGDGGNIHNEGAMTPCVLTTADCGNNNAQGGAAAADAEVFGYANDVLTITADKINYTEVESSGDAHVDVSELDKSIQTLVIQSLSQNNLAAIVVNNVVGRNQVATGFNVSSQGPALVGNQNGKAQVAFVAPTNGFGDYRANTQSNTINQYRGTPFDQSKLPVAP